MMIRTFALMVALLALPLNVSAQDDGAIEHAGPQGTLADEVGFLFAALNRAEFEVLSASPSHFFAFDVDIEARDPSARIDGVLR